MLLIQFQEENIWYLGHVSPPLMKCHIPLSSPTSSFLPSSFSHLLHFILLFPPSSFTITSPTSYSTSCSSSSSSYSSFLSPFPSPSLSTVMNTLLIPQHSTFPNNYFLITQFNVRFIVYPERQIKGVMSRYSKHLHVHMRLVDFQRKARQQT